MSTNAEIDHADEFAAPPSGTRRREAFLAAFWVLFGIAVIFLARAIEVTRSPDAAIGPRWWPELLGWGIILAAVALLVQALMGKLPPLEQDPASRAGRLFLVCILALVVAYLVAWQSIGFLIATTALLVALPALFGARGVKALVLFPLVTVAVLYGIFAMILRVPL